MLSHAKYGAISRRGANVYTLYASSVSSPTRVMGYPIGQKHIDCSNVENAHLLEGDLMLILEELDNNVDPASTLQLVDKLIEHDK